MPDLPYGKIILALTFIFIITKATVVLMWTLIAAVVVWMVRLFDRNDKFATK